MLRGRSYGVLMHVTSLPSPFGVGDFGPAARDFVKILSTLGKPAWQVLPLTQTGRTTSYSPYSGPSAFAMNTLLISPEDLAEEGLVDKSLIERLKIPPKPRAEYRAAEKTKEKVVSEAFEKLKEDATLSGQFEAFIEENRWWLLDYALFEVLTELHGGRPWVEWKREFRDREKDALDSLLRERRNHIEYVMFKQFLAFRQWRRLRGMARRSGIVIVGDIPYYVDHNSADVWANRHLFKLDAKGRPLYVGGVPPDYFSRTGQLWGNPVYDWEAHREEGFRWWVLRLAHALSLYDVVRLDHFRGFMAYWEVRAGSLTAEKGRWVRVPYEEFFETLARSFPSMPFIAEDLGFITADVREVMLRYSLPGMRVLVFAFSGDPRNEHLPHNLVRNMVIYTSTHDTNTVLGWFTDEASRKSRSALKQYLGRRVTSKNVVREVTRLAMASPPSLAVVQMQDAMMLGSEARMNRPGTSKGNWLWRAVAIRREDIAWVAELAQIYGRVTEAVI